MEALADLSHLNYSSLSINRFIRPQVSGGKIALPLSQYSVYAQFKHIEAVPAGPGGSGYSLSKARVLDTLIDRLVQLKERNLSKPSSQDTGTMSEEALDAMIQEYSQRLNIAMKTGLQKLEADFGTNFAGAPVPSSTTQGAIINLVA